MAVDAIYHAYPGENTQSHGSSDGEAPHPRHIPHLVCLGREKLSLQVLPHPIGGGSLDGLHLFLDYFQPIFAHRFILTLPKYSLIFFARIILALYSCEADVLSVIPSSSDISLWFFSSRTKRLNTAL